MNDDLDTLAVWQEAASAGGDALVGFDVPAIINQLCRDLRDCRAERAELLACLRDVVDAANGAKRETDPNYYEPLYVRRARALLERLDRRPE